VDYGTFFFTNIASVTVYAVCVGLLAWYNRRLIGMRWFAASLLTGLAKLILQGLEGRLRPECSDLPANELYLVSIGMQFLGLRWFVVRKPMQFVWPGTAVGAVLGVYTVLFLAKIAYSGNIINIPFVGICLWSAWVVARGAKGPFSAVSRVTAAVLCGQAGVAGYRAVLTNLSYSQPWKTVEAQPDPRWLYSLAAGAFLAAFMAMCFLWYMMTELERELAEQARTDPLTGALNRRAMEHLAGREAARSIRANHPLSMILLDIDDFKHLNDTRGHAAGDRALQALVVCARSMLRQQDCLARTGGEEFAVLLPDTEASSAVTVAERIRKQIEALAIPFESGPIRLTISAGVSRFDPRRGLEAMIRSADAAMYEAKEQGRNRVSMRALDPVTV
jgi:diguanylate cyclase (GGDEF)-like protein